MVGHVTNTPSNPYYYGLDFSNSYFRLYKYDNFTVTYSSNFSISDITFTSTNAEIAYITNATRSIYKLNTSSNLITQTVNMTNKYP